MPKEAGKQGGLTLNWEIGLCPWHFWVSSCWASHPSGASLSHLFHAGKKDCRHKGLATTFSGLPTSKTFKREGGNPRQTGCGGESTSESSDLRAKQRVMWSKVRCKFFFIPQEQTHRGAINRSEAGLTPSSLLPKFWGNRGELPAGEKFSAHRAGNWESYLKLKKE